MAHLERYTTNTAMLQPPFHYHPHEHQETEHHYVRGAPQSEHEHENGLRNFIAEFATDMHFNGGDGHNDEHHNHNHHNEKEDPTAGWTPNKALQTLVSLVVFSFNIIALVVSDNDQVRKTCGTDLWNVVLACFIMHQLWFVAYGCLGVLFSFVLRIKPEWTMVIIGAMICVQECILIALTVMFALKAVTLDGCTDALSDNFTHGPVLVVMAWIWVASCSVVLLMVALFCVFGATVLSFSSNY